MKSKVQALQSKLDQDAARGKALATRSKAAAKAEAQQREALQQQQARAEKQTDTAEEAIGIKTKAAAQQIDTLLAKGRDKAAKITLKAERQVSALQQEAAQAKAATERVAASTADTVATMKSQAAEQASSYQ